MVIAGALLLATILAAQEPAPQIDVYTMGVGDEVFAHFGHAAICVSDVRCYNYGTADFSTPVPLTYAFIRGRALFWVSVIDRATMIRYYVEDDRSLWRQRLQLPDQEARDLARSLEASTSESEKYYRYHHFNDNCTTRIRDLIDRAVGGALKQKTMEPHDGPTFRDYARRGFAGYPVLLVAANLLLGRPSDHATSVWEGMFLPQIMREAIEAHLHTKPELVYARRAKDEGGPLWAGDALLASLGLLLSAMIFAAHRFLPRAERAVRALAGIPIGLVGLVLWILAVASAFVELRENELLAVLMPFDLALGFLAGPKLALYARGRLAIIAFALVLSWVGILAQPLWPGAILAGAPLAACVLTTRPARAS
jgi:hypothetical protein